MCVSVCVCVCVCVRMCVSIRDTIIMSILALLPVISYHMTPPALMHAHCKKRIVILTTVVCYLVVGDNTLHAWTQLIAKMV